MKEFARGLGTLIASLLVFTPIMFVGLVYSLPYSAHLLFSGSGVGSVLVYWWRMIDGFFAALGFIMYQGAIGWDYAGNVWGGEIMEDTITHVEDSKFTDKNTTISASIGELELRGEQFTNDRGKVLSRVLNIAFNQKQHAKDSWHLKVHEETADVHNFEALKK